MPSDLVDAVVKAVESVIGPEPVGLHDPLFGQAEDSYLRAALSSTNVSSAAPIVTAFEERLAAECGVKHAVSTVNGTAALHVALRLAGVGPDDVVLISPLSFVAPANAIAYCGARPVFVDVDSETWGMDPHALEQWLRTSTVRAGDDLVTRSTGATVRAVIAVDVFGHPCDFDQISNITAEFGLTLIEDAAGALGSHWHGRACGSFGALSTVSFNGNKTVTAGGGGAILSDDDHLAHRARHLTTTAKRPHAWRYFHDEVGFNYRMPGINAALALGQIERLDSLLMRKRHLYLRYREAFRGLEGVRLRGETPGARSNFWLQNLVLEDDSKGQRDELLQMLNGRGWTSRPAWELLSELPAFSSCARGPLAVAEYLAKRVVSIPSGPGLA